MSDDSMIDEFKIEAAEMFENAEVGLLNIDKGLDFNSNYNSIFRSFHSLKGAAGMFGMEELQSHMHKLESLFEAQKKIGSMKKNQVDYFLQGIDVARAIMNGEEASFDHIDLDKFNLDDSKAPVEVKVEVAVKQQEKQDKHDKHEKHEKLDRGGGVIFIVDDEPDIVDLLSEIIDNNNYVIHKYYNGEEAVQAVEHFKPDVILSDIMMPKLNGIEMIKAIHEISSTTPVIFISGNLSKEKMQEALQFGAYAFVDKPFSNSEILNIVRNAVKKSQAMLLLEKSINYILYQFSDLDDYLATQGKENIRLTLKQELQTILEQRKILKEKN